MRTQWHYTLAMALAPLFVSGLALAADDQKTEKADKATENKAASDASKQPPADADTKVGTRRTTACTIATATIGTIAIAPTASRFKSGNDERFKSYIDRDKPWTTRDEADKDWHTSDYYWRD